MSNINGYYEFGNTETDSQISLEKLEKAYSKIHNEKLISALVLYNSQISKSNAYMLLTDKSIYYQKRRKFNYIDITDIKKFNYDIDNHLFIINNQKIKEPSVSRTSIQNMAIKVSKQLNMKIEEKEIKATTYTPIEEKNNIVKCPKCGSTSIAITNKKLSVSRGIVGGALFGAVGAGVGAVTSKKIYNVCQVCGHKWKI